ncbi:hypothetical protein AN958_07225 [Leucoagaricus sp. SymC.cos]|nr:hypothetical protein AN958_07225 [Leucoagaricus sp. SymC.cos]
MADDTVLPIPNLALLQHLFVLSYEGITEIIGVEMAPYYKSITSTSSVLSLDKALLESLEKANNSLQNVLPPPTNIQAPDNFLFENDLSYAVGSRNAQSTFNLTYLTHLDAENSFFSTTAVQAAYDFTGSSSDLSFNTSPSSTAYSLSSYNTNYLTTATSFDAQTPLPVTWDETYLAAPLHQEFANPTLTNSLASDNTFTELSSNMSYNVGPSSLPSVPSGNYANAWEVSSSLQTQAGLFPGLYMDPPFENSISLYDGTYPGTSQLCELSQLPAPPAIPALLENDLQTTPCSSIEHSYQPRSSGLGSTQISGSAVSSSSVTSGIKRRSYSPLANDSENPGPSKRHRTTQYSRTQADAHSATSGGTTDLVGEQNQIIARQVTPVLVQGATTTTSSQISGDSGKAPLNNPLTALNLIELALWPTAELTGANKHTRTLDGSSANPLNVSSKHTQENRSTGRPNVHAAGLFPAASNFAINNSTIVEQNICTQSDEPPKCLKWLEEYIMKGAELDSFERDPPPRCHPDTRTTLIQQAEDWFTQPPEGKRLLWLRGPAGVGKSAIIQTLAEGWREERKLGASLFFSRERRHTDPRQVFPSLAYQLATRDASYAAYISDVMIRDPRSLKKAMNEQFRVLFIEPFSRRRIGEGSETWVITIDGLDECGDDRQTGRHSTSIHREIVQLVSNFAAQNPSVPLLWIIASRPEAHLKAVFDEETIRTYFFDVEVPVDSDEAQQDVEKYLVIEFKKIREQYPDLIHETAWPIHRQFVKIVEASRGYFVFAAVLVRFIEDPNVANPIDQLKWVMRAITRILLSRKQIRNPLAVLDELYTEILEGIKPEVFQVTRQILGASMFLDQKGLHRGNWNLAVICNSLSITRDAALTSLRPLCSVVKLPLRYRPGFYHTSFRDFLQDPLRSRAYSIDPGHKGGEIIQQVVTWLFEKLFGGYRIVWFLRELEEC